MSLEKFLDKKIVVVQTGSSSKLNPKQKASLIGLGLRRIGSSSEFVASPSILGMIRRVNHVVTIKA